MLSFFHRSFCLFERTLHSCLFENDFRFLSHKCCIPIYKGNCTKSCHFMQGMMWLYARNIILLEKYCRTRHVLEDFALKTTWKGHAKTCLLILFSSLGCVVFPPMVSSKFLGGCPNHSFEIWKIEQRVVHRHQTDEHHQKAWQNRNHRISTTWGTSNITLSWSKNIEG